MVGRNGSKIDSSCAFSTFQAADRGRAQNAAKGGGTAKGAGATNADFLKELEAKFMPRV
eukprot:SAG31_NODE_11280_length_1046_cov_1.794087_4_plen_58_part_01